MYQPNQPMGVPPTQPASSNRSTIIIIVLVALLFIFLTAIIAGGLGYWIGSRPVADQATNVKNSNVTAPTAAPTVQPATPTQTPTATPTPTPDVGGKYSGPSGDVEITNVTDKSFSFNIGVGNSNGSGQIDGQATRTSPTLAVYSKIPDPDLYNDPDSDYYHKKCRLTFRFTAGKLAVSEDDFACNYWHGAAVDFNGTFTHKGK